MLAVSALKSDGYVSLFTACSAATKKSASRDYLNFKNRANIILFIYLNFMDELENNNLNGVVKST